MDTGSTVTAAEPKVWSPDELIPFGKYLLLDRISVGATAILYRGRTHGEAGFERLVAVKRVLPHMAGDEDFVKTFVREAKTAARLTHTNICPIFELGKVGESLYMTMEYVAGKDIGKISRRLRAQEKAIPPAVAAWIISKLCDALDYAHNLRNIDGEPIGIIHRDISPPNILISYEGQVKLIDFGLAKAVGQAQQTSIDALKQKLSYMSPEMIKGRVLDHRSDIFGLGVCLYEMITSRQLFAGKDDIATLKLVSAASIPPPSAILEDAPEELEIIAMRALEREPEDRWQSAEEMNTALQAYLHKEHPGFGIRQLSEWVQEYFKEEMLKEQTRLNELLEASRRPGIIEERKKFFTSPEGAAAIAKAEVIRRMSGAPLAPAVISDIEGKLPALPPPAAVPAAGLKELDEEIEELDDFEIVEELDASALKEELPAAAAPALARTSKPVRGEAGFDEEPTFFYEPALIDPGEFEEDATQIFFNKEEGIGMAELYQETGAPGRTPPISPLPQPLETAASLVAAVGQTPQRQSPLPPPRQSPIPSAAQPASVTPSGPRPRAPDRQMYAVPSAPIWRSMYAWVPGFGLGLLIAAIGALMFFSLRKPDTGSIEIRTYPPVPAAVIMDGIDRGRTPMRMDGVPVGPRRLDIQADGFKPVVRVVQLSKGATAILEISLDPVKALITGEAKASQSQPATQGAKPASPPSGQTGTTVAASGSILAAAMQRADLDQGTLIVDSTPWARVFLDEKDTGGNTPISLLVKAGEHQVALRTPDGKMHVEKVTVFAGKTLELTPRYVTEPPK